MSLPCLRPRHSAPERHSTRSPFPPVQTGPPLMRTPPGSAPPRVRTALGARSPRSARSACTRLALWVSNGLPLSRSTILTTGICKPVLITCKFRRCASANILFRPTHIHSFTCRGHLPYPITVLHSQPSFLFILSILGGMYSCNHVSTWRNDTFHSIVEDLVERKRHSNLCGLHDGC